MKDVSAMEISLETYLMHMECCPRGVDMVCKRWSHKLKKQHEHIEQSHGACGQLKQACRHWQKGVRNCKDTMGKHAGADETGMV